MTLLNGEQANTERNANLTVSEKLEQGIIAASDVTTLADGAEEFISVFMPNFSLSQFEVYNMVQNPKFSAGDSINKDFMLAGVVGHNVIVTNERTGTVDIAPRLVLFSTDGLSMVSVSKSMLSSLKKLLMFCPPTSWPKEGLKVRVKQESKGEKRYYSLEIATPTATNSKAK